jgi:hypothetical protein
MKPHEMYERLESQGYIGYGTTIPAVVLKDMIKHDHTEGWAFLGPYLLLKEYIEAEGYFCTSKDMAAGSLHILPLEQMTEKVESLQKLLIKRQKKAITTMTNAKFENLSQEAMMEHMHATNKLSASLQAVKSCLYSVR